MRPTGVIALTDHEESVAKRSPVIPIIAGALIIGALAILGALYFLNASDDDPKGDIEVLDLAAPISDSSGTTTTIRMRVDPVRKGSNEVEVLFGSPNDPPVVPPASITNVEITGYSLKTGEAIVSSTLPRNGDDQFTGTLEIPENGWYEVNVGLSTDSGVSPGATFFLLAPDPNVNGFDAVPRIDSVQTAEQLYLLGLNATTSLSSLSYTERLSSGVGTVVVAERRVSDGSDGNPPVSSLKAPQMEILTVGDQTWQRPADGSWIERTKVDVYPPSEWGDLYPGATDFGLGITEEIDGVQAQVIFFHAPPSERWVAAWYVWWIDPATGNVMQEAMTSQLHYMRYHFFAFDEPVKIDPPILDATPVAATPAAG